MPATNQPVTARRFDRAKLKAAREAAGYTREQLACRLGRSFPTVAGYEWGSREPGRDALFALADVLGVGTDDLLTDRPAT